MSIEYDTEYLYPRIQRKMHSSTSLMTPSALALLLALPTLISASCSIQGGVTTTFYGYPDNSPPGADIAYTQCGRSAAGGTGTYDDPLTFASAEGEFQICDVIYAPYLKKYLRFEDECDQCTSDWNNGGTWHIDVWTGSSTQDGGQNQIDCEDNLTPESQSIILNPDSGLEVDSKFFLFVSTRI